MVECGAIKVKSLTELRHVVWYGMIWYGLVLYGMVRYCMVWKIEMVESTAIDTLSVSGTKWLDGRMAEWPNGWIAGWLDGEVSSNLLDNPRVSLVTRPWCLLVP